MTLQEDKSRNAAPRELTPSGTAPVNTKSLLPLAGIPFDELGSPSFTQQADAGLAAHIADDMDDEAPWDDAIRTKIRKRAAEPRKVEKAPQKLTIVFKPQAPFKVDKISYKAVLPEIREQIQFNGLEIRLQTRTNVIAVDVKPQKEANELVKLKR